MKKKLILLLFVVSALNARGDWESFKEQTVDEMERIPGWCTREKALVMMDVIRDNHCQNCVEIGVFAGKSLYPIAQALKYHGSGEIVAIDAWNPAEAIKGFQFTDPNYAWWGQLDYPQYHRNTLRIIKRHGLKNHCKVIKRSSREAVSSLSDESIDFIHFDGNHNGEYAYADVVEYLPKVKDGGVILLNDPNWFSMKRALVFLLERADVVSPYKRSATYLLFRRNKQREEVADQLMEDSF